MKIKTGLLLLIIFATLDVHATLPRCGGTSLLRR